MKSTIIILLIIISFSTFACRPSYSGIRIQMENATDIYQGRVTGIKNVSYEKSLQIKSKPDIITVPESYLNRIYITRILKGKEESIIESDVTLCKNYYDIRENVYVFKNTESNNIFAISKVDLKRSFKDTYKKLTKKIK